MTLDNHERLNKGFVVFWWFWAARHFSRANCAEINWDRHRQAACEILASLSWKQLEIDWQFANRNCY